MTTADGYAVRCGVTFTAHNDSWSAPSPASKVIVRLHTFVPLILYLVVLGWATHKSTAEPVPPEHEAADLDNLGFSPKTVLVILELLRDTDYVLRSFSTLIPYVYLALCSIMLNFKRLTGRTCVMLLMWISITVFRLVVYIPISRTPCETPVDTHIKTCNYYFSDHMWLISSLIAQLQTVLSVLAMGVNIPKSLSWKCLFLAWMLVGWIIMIFLYIESFNTARYWHTKEAVWAAALTGIPCYQLPVCWWLRLLEKSAEQKAALGTNSLVEDIDGYRAMEKSES